jgi:RNA polymerase sigma-70 factor (ECF subfamily)
MENESKSGTKVVTALSATSSGAAENVNEARLSDADGVNRDVGTAAMDRSLLDQGRLDGAMLGGGIGARGAAGAGVMLMGPISAAAGDGMTDADVMLRVKGGDQAAFDWLVAKYRRPMVNFLYRMSRNTAAAEDLAQEVFLRVYRSRESYEASAKFTTWLYRIASNLAVNHARDTKHERPEVMASLDEPDAETGTTMDVADPHVSVEEELVRRERMQAIRARVEALPERQKMAVVLHKYQQMDYRQIGEVMKLSESATKSLLFRAYETLREELKQFC